jgi:hypothetical protein
VRLPPDGLDSRDRRAIVAVLGSIVALIVYAIARLIAWAVS